MRMRIILSSVAAAALLGAPAYAEGPTAAAADHHGMKKDIVETAVAADGFDTLVAALQAAGLVETLQGDGPFTVFAPTDEAFAALPEGALEDLLKPENKDQLTTILTYHVVPGKVLSSDLAGKELEADTAAGLKLPIDATDGVVAGGANVIQADIETSNGVIHVIDKVMLPAS